MPLALMLVLTATAASLAQQPVCGVAEIAVPDLRTSPLVPKDHWAVRALGRAYALGLVPDFLAAQHAVPRADVARHLGSAALRAAQQESSFAPVVRGWCETFLDEFPEVLLPPAESSWPRSLSGSRLDAAYVTHTGVVSPGTKSNGWSAIQRPDETGPQLAASLRLTPLRHLGLLIEPKVDGAGVSLDTWAAVAPVGPFTVLAGRQPVAYGSAESGAVTLSGVVPLSGIQVFTRHPFRPPGLLRFLGMFSAHTFFSRLREPRHPGDPWFWGANLVWQPHERLTLSGNRVAIFGGDSVSVPTTPRAVLEMLWGDTEERTTNSFENQNASVEVAYRPPIEAFVPLLVYVEAGMEDIDVVRALRDSPGIVAGISIPSFPSLPALQLGIERAYFGETTSESRNGVWYQHGYQVGGWAVAEGPLGHSLGGHGTETLVFARIDLYAGRLRVKGNYFDRLRGHQNLYAPEREGRSTGFMLQTLWRVRPGTEIRLAEYSENGQSWSEHRFESGISMRY